MATKKAVSVHVHTRRPLKFGAAGGAAVWFTCPEFEIGIETDGAEGDGLTVFLGGIEHAKMLADEIYAHCRKQAAAYQAKAEAMAAAGQEVSDV